MHLQKFIHIKLIKTKKYELFIFRDDKNRNKEIRSTISFMTKIILYCLNTNLSYIQLTRARHWFKKMSDHDIIVLKYCSIFD